MRVVCDNCRAVYKIPDDKLMKPVNKATCRNCGHRMLIPRPPRSADEEHTIVANNPATPGVAIPRAGGPSTTPIHDPEPEHTLPIAQQRGTAGRNAPRSGRSWGTNPDDDDDDDLPLLPGTPMPEPPRNQRPGRLGADARPSANDEKTSWVRNPPATPTLDFGQAGAGSEEPTRINARPLTPAPPPPRRSEPVPAPAASPIPPRPRNPDPLPNRPSFTGYNVGHDPSGDLGFALAGTLGSIFGIVLLSINPRIDSIILETVVRAIALILAFGGSFTTFFILATSGRGRRPARLAVSLSAATILALLGVTSAIGLNTLAFMWKNGDLSFTPQPIAALPEDLGSNLAQLEAEAEADSPPPAPIVEPAAQRETPKAPPSRTAQHNTPIPAPSRPAQPTSPAPKVTVSVPSARTPDPTPPSTFDDDPIAFDDPAPPPPVRRAPEPPPEPAGPPMVAMEVIDIQLRNNMDVKKCFFAHIQANGAPPARIDVRFTLEPTGNVSRAAITQAAYSGTELDRCLSKAVKGIQFPPFSGDATKITFPFIFQ